MEDYSFFIHPHHRMGVIRKLLIEEKYMDTIVTQCENCEIDIDYDPNSKDQRLCDDCLEKKQKEFNSIVNPVIRWLNNNCNPHNSIEITCNSAELKVGEMCHKTDIFIKD